MTIRTLFRVAGAALVLTLTACAGVDDSETTSNTSETIAEDLSVYATPDALQTLLEEHPDAFVLVDVRSTDEYRAGHIPGAVHRDYREIAEDPPTDDLDMPIIVYCKSGARASTAESTLVNLGYTRVFNWGGIIDWPYETVTGASAE